MASNCDQNEWELSKENVLPLKQGRNISNLTAGLQPSVDQAVRIKQERLEYESELRTYDGDDPLDVWCRYICWTEQNFPKGGKESHIQDLLQRCVTGYKDDDRYRNDPRYLSIWIKFANICKDSTEIYAFLFSQQIGGKLASFYEAWASELEHLGNTKKADTIYCQGLETGAEPVELLKQRHSEFQARVTRRIAGEIVDAPESVTVVEDPKRTALGALKGRGTRSCISSDRSSTKGVGVLRQSMVPNSINQAPFTIANDENSHSQHLQRPSGEWGSVPTSASHKENIQAPGVWSKAKMKQKHQPVVKINEISSIVKAEFSVHTDSDQQQPIVMPRKLNPQFDQVLSAKKPEKNPDPFYAMQHPAVHDPSQRPMYLKHLIYAGAVEFTFEELRAAKWIEKQKRAEDLRIKEDIEREREELRKQQKQMVDNQQQMKDLMALHRREQEESMKLMTLQREEQEALKQQRELLLHEKQQMRQEMQQQMEQERLKQQEQMVPLSSRKQELHRSIALKEREQVTNRSRVYLEASLHSSMDTTANLVGSENLSTTRTPSLSINASIVTPNMSSLQAANSSSSTSKLTAPSPTVNTKQAISTVLSMFNGTMNVADQFGWDTKDITDPVDANGGKTPSAGFAIFDENAASGKIDIDAPLTIFEDKENSVPVKKVTGSRRALGLHDQAPAAQENEPSLPVSNMTCMELGETIVHTMATEVEILHPVIAEQQREEGMDFIENMPNDFTFAPGFSSTCNFSNFAEAARVASTPSGDMVPLPEPPLSTIKGGISVSNDSTTESNDSSKRISMYMGRTNAANDLSPIIERSDEDVKSHQTNSSTIGPESQCGDTTLPNSTVHALHGKCQNTTITLSSKPNINMTSKIPRLVEALHTINEEESKAQELGDKTCHEIDISNYIPKEDDTKLLEMSVAIDPNDPFDQDMIDEFLHKLPAPLSSFSNYHTFNEMIPDVIPGEPLELGKHKYDVVKLLGKGAFAKVLIVKKKDGRTKPFEVLKFQKPPCPWEFYICSELIERLKKLVNPSRMCDGIMSINEGYFFIDGSCMTNSLHTYGTLLDLVNWCMKFVHKPNLPEHFLIVLALDMITIMEQMHQCRMIHGDIKPDNMLLTQLPVMNCLSAREFLAKRKPSVKLIDFGRSIDMTKFPDGTTFTVAVQTSNFQCIEMKTNQPWTYQTDLFGLVGSIHVLFFHTYMTVFQVRGEWKTTCNFKRRFVSGEIFLNMFNKMLNIPSCDQLPELGTYRTQLEDLFVEHYSDISVILSEMKDLQKEMDKTLVNKFLG